MSTSADPGRISISVVVPAYNEAGRIAAAIEALCEYLRRSSWDWEVRVVDDGSTDDTVRKAQVLASAEARVIVQREPHRGKGGAVRAGLLASRGAFRFMCDADLAMPVEQLWKFLPPINTADVAIATREGDGAMRVGEPLYRHLAGRAFNVATQLLLLPGLKDSQCGYKMFTAAAVDAIFPDVETNGWGFDLEVLAIARARGLRVVEVPIEWHYRSDSRLRITRDAVGMFRELLAIRRRSRTDSYRRRN